MTRTFHKTLFPAGWSLLLWAGLAAGMYPGLAGASTRGERVRAELMKKGQAALEDKLYDLAEKDFERFIRESPDEAGKSSGTLQLAKVLFAQGRFEDATNRLSAFDVAGLEPATAAGFVVWKARALQGLDHTEDMLETIADYGRRFPGDPRLQQVFQLRIQGYLKLGQTEQALQAFARFHDEFGKSPEAPKNLLDWSDALRQAGREDQGLDLLDQLIRDYADSPFAVEGQLRMGRILSHEQRWNEAQKILTDLVDVESSPISIRAAAWTELAGVYDAQTNYTRSAAVLTRAARQETDPGIQTTINICLGKILIRTGKVDEGLALVKEAVVKLPSREEAARVQLEISEILLDEKIYQRAVEQFQSYLEAFSEEAGVARALMGKGWSLWERGQYAEAAAAFEKALGLETDPAVKEQALMKAADAYFADGQYTQARKTYGRLPEEFADSALIPQARYQKAEALARLKDLDGAQQEFSGLMDRFPQSPEAEEASLRLGQLDEEQNRWDDAVAAYNRAMTSYPDGRTYYRALRARGLVRYRQAQFEPALADFEKVVKDLKEGELAEQAYYLRGWCLFLMGKSDAALVIGRSFLERYPDSIWSADVLFWLGEYAFNQRQYAEAENIFGRMSDAHPQSPLAADALFWAGRAAAEQAEYLRAIDHYKQLSKSYPGSPRLPETRFAQGDALSELGEFSGAILAFEEIIKKYPDSYLVDPAWGRLGDCHFTLAGEDAGRYQQAMACFKTILGSSASSSDLKMQAEYKLGRCFDKTGDQYQAFEHYMNVVYNYFLEGEKGSAPSPLWFTRAAFDAAAIQETEQNWEQAINIYRRVEEAGVPAAPDALNRIKKIQAEHRLPANPEEVAG